MADYIETPTMGEILNEKFLITPPLGHFWRIYKMKKRIIIFLLVLISLNLYSQDITKINLEEYKLDSRITSTLVEETKNSKTFNIYQENNLIYVLGWSKDGKLAFIENRGIDGRGGHDLHFTIQDMVEDVNVFYKRINWYDDDNIAIKNNKYKLLSKIENKMCDYVMPTAFIKSPYEDRIALIVANAEYVFEGREVFINFYGCNLESGFTNQIK